MKLIKIFFLIHLFVGISTNVWSQVGINTESPKATLDVTALPNSSSAIDGLIAPRLSGNQLQNKNNLYTSDQEGAIVYVLSASPGTGIADDKTRNVTRAGYYYFDGTLWVPIIISASNGLNVPATTQNVQLGGSLIQPTTISDITSQNYLFFKGTGINAISFNDSTLSVDATNSRVGVNTIAPLKTLDVEGTLRLSQNIEENTPTRLSNNAKPVYVDTSNGTLYYGPDGFTTIAGGFRPGTNFLIKTLRTTSSITRVRFICHINRSSDANNSITQAYAYGDLTIIGLGTSNPIKFVEVNIKDYQGQPKVLTTSNDTIISWSNYTQGTTTLSLDRATGEFRVKNTVSSISYIFEVLGGM